MQDKEGYAALFMALFAKSLQPALRPKCRQNSIMDTSCVDIPESVAMGNLATQ